MAHADLIPAQKHILAGDKESSCPAILPLGDDAALLPRRSPQAEIESIRRTLYNALNKLDQLQGNLKTT